MSRQMASVVWYGPVARPSTVRMGKRCFRAVLEIHRCGESVGPPCGQRKGGRTEEWLSSSASHWTPPWPSVTPLSSFLDSAYYYTLYSRYR